MILTPPTDFISILLSFLTWVMDFFGNNLPMVMMFFMIAVFGGFIFSRLTTWFFGRRR